MYTKSINGDIAIIEYVEEIEMIRIMVHACWIQRQTYDIHSIKLNLNLSPWLLSTARWIILVAIMYLFLVL